VRHATHISDFGVDGLEAILSQALVWKLRGDGSLEPVAVTLGITAHTYTELTGVPAGSLKPGEEVVTTTLSSKTPLPGARK